MRGIPNLPYNSFISILTLELDPGPHTYKASTLQVDCVSILTSLIQVSVLNANCLLSVLVSLPDYMKDRQELSTNIATGKLGME